MKRLARAGWLVTLLGVAVLAGCSAPAARRGSPPVAACQPELEPGDLYERAGVQGVFVVRNEATGCVQATDRLLADTPFPPQSTFKLANTLIGLQTGELTGPEQTWKWDGSSRAVAAWEADLDLASALQFSCVPCFQQLARAIGEQRMREYLRDFDYGDQQISGPIDQFWLGGPLRITPREQVEFLHRMLSGQLPVDPAHVELMWSMLELESAVGVTFRGKTGLGYSGDRVIGWLVGYVERDGQRWTYATFVTSREGADHDEAMQRIMPLRFAFTREYLARESVLPALP